MPGRKQGSKNKTQFGCKHCTRKKKKRIVYCGECQRKVEEVVGEVGEEEATVVEAEDVVEVVGEVGEDAEEDVETIESVVGGCISQKYLQFINRN